MTLAAGQHIAIRRTRARGERPGRPGSTWTTTGARATAGATTIKPAKGWVLCALTLTWQNWLLCARRDARA